MLCSPPFHSSLTKLLCGLGQIHIASRSGHWLGHRILIKYWFVSCHSEEVNTKATYSKQSPLVLSPSSEQTSMLCLKHKLLSNECQIPGKQELNQMYYLGPGPLLLSTFFTLPLISPQAINEIYNWHQLERGEKGLVTTRGEGEWRPGSIEQGA